MTEELFRGKIGMDALRRSDKPYLPPLTTRTEEADHLPAVECAPDVPVWRRVESRSTTKKKLFRRK